MYDHDLERKSDTISLTEKTLREIPTPHTLTTYKLTKLTKKMKNFFSQNWVIALLVVAVLAVVCYVAFSKKKETVPVTTTTTTTANADGENQ